MLPTIGTTGYFTFAEPYASLINPNQQFTVVSIRTIPELEASGEKPYETIYVPVNESSTTYADDLNNDVAIVTFRTDGGEYFYVPENKILSDTKLTGYKYIEKGVLINLGWLPIDTNLDTLEANIKDVVYDTIGVTPLVTVTDTSSTVYVDKVKHNELSLARANKATVAQSYRTRYYELLEKYDNLQALMAKIEETYII